MSMPIRSRVKLARQHIRYCADKIKVYKKNSLKIVSIFLLVEIWLALVNGRCILQVFHFRNRIV